MIARLLVICNNNTNNDNNKMYNIQDVLNCKLCLAMYKRLQSTHSLQVCLFIHCEPKTADSFLLTLFTVNLLSQFFTNIRYLTFKKYLKTYLFSLSF